MTSKSVLHRITGLFLCCVLSAGAQAQTTPAPTPPPPPPPPAGAPAAAPLAMPAMIGPLSTASPATFDAGRYFGKLQVTGILSGFVYVQDNHSLSDHLKYADVSNAQVFVQKTSGLVQYYLQGGAYNLPALGTPFLSTRDTVTDFYGALPQGYIKLAPKGSFSYLAGKLPTLIGAEDTFTFENMNIERGLLWNQENAVNRGLQVNYSKGKISSSLTWNDGFYSNRYNWITGLFTYTANAANSVEFVGGGNYGKTGYSSVATPLYQNNSSIYNVIYTHTAKKWILEPYIQITHVPMNTDIGVGHATSTIGGAVLGTYTFTPHVTLAARGEYLASTGSTSDGSVNLMYGTGSDAWSMTLTPTYQDNAFFARAEFSAVHAMDTTAGDVFGSSGTNATQVRGIIEAGFMF
ncbi:MAG TPA: outer membrane beta-barrel protein [Acidobacteriaceae bacterium]|nr:outer membrane beta-barrel protein [Acidobacteriaceae bacterium]